MTPVQNSAIEEVRRILKANFDSFILVYRVTNEGFRSEINQDWHGHISDVVGLAAISHNRMLEFTSLKAAPNAGQP